jgi:transposase
MLTDTQWAMLEPLVEQCRPKGKTPPQDLRRTFEALLWQHENGAKWRAVPAKLGPWWRAAQTFIRWARLGVWERLLNPVQECGIQLDMAFLDGTNVRASEGRRGSPKRGSQAQQDHREALGRLILSLSKDSWRLWHQGLRDRRWAWTRHRVSHCTRSGARAA